MIRIKIKVKNDHISLTESFERDTLMLSMDDEDLKSMVAVVLEKFNQPVEEIQVKTVMEL